MKVLWFSNCVIGNTTCKGSGSWLFAMKGILSDSVELYNITHSNVSDIVHNKCNDVDEYILPTWELTHGIPSMHNIAKIVTLVEKIEPDIIHVWGIEEYWALLFCRGYIKRRALLEIQGLLSSCYDVYYAGLTSSELLRCIGIKELFKPCLSEFFQRRITKNKSMKELECLNSFSYISTQSNWTRKQLRYLIDDNSVLYETFRPIRNNFYKAPKWEYPSNKRKIIFSSLSYYTPFKGLHILLKAVALLKKKYPEVLLKIAGNNIKNKAFYRKSGYERLILSLINSLGINKNVEFLGYLDANCIVKELQNSNVFVNPSFVESYSAATAEALYLGVPSVLAYSGAMPDFSENEQIAFYYSPLDYKSCAAQIGTLFENRIMCKSISLSAINVMNIKCDSSNVKNKQMFIYEDFIKNNSEHLNSF